MIPYTLGGERLDRIYLDTTFATTSRIYEGFPSKAEGIRELLRKVKEYPEDTVFYLRNWTFGYEEVWLALSAALKTKVKSLQSINSLSTSLLTFFYIRYTLININSGCTSPLQPELGQGLASTILYIYAASN